MDKVSSEPGTAAPESSEFAREWTEILNEIRVALPGVQLLFGFLLAVPFTEAFRALSGLVRYSYFFCFLTTTASCAFLIAPSVYHRLHWRRDVRDKELMLQTCNLLAIVGEVLLAVAMTSAVYVISLAIAGRTIALLVGTAAGLGFAALWFALPLLRRGAERRV
jgi:predicted membrane channel-forming protein YqfA (hemolysin III family)